MQLSRLVMVMDTWMVFWLEMIGDQIMEHSTPCDSILWSPDASLKCVGVDSRLMLPVCHKISRDAKYACTKHLCRYARSYGISPVQAGESLQVR